MDHKPVPSLQIEAHQASAMNLVGTVALPSPVPAEGRIFVVRQPATPAPKAAAVKPAYHVKIFQKITDNHAITRFVDVENVRMIRFSPEEATQTSGEGKPAETLSNDDLKKELTAIPWVADGVEDCHVLEVELRPGRTGVAHVFETAPVLMRYECTVTAATSLENIAGSGVFRTQRAKLACPPCC